MFHGPPYRQYQPANSKMAAAMTPQLNFSRQVGMARDNARRIAAFNQLIKICGLFITSLFRRFFGA
jgi:hypothetical protein